MAARKAKPEEVSDAELDAAVEAVAPTSKNSVTVSWPGGSRVYSKEVHGADFRDLAKEFASKRPDRTVA